MLADGFTPGARRTARSAKTKAILRAADRRPPGAAELAPWPSSTARAGSLEDLAETVVKRHAALAMLLTDMQRRPGAAAALTPAATASPTTPRRCDRMRTVRLDQERLLEQAEASAKTPRRPAAPGLPPRRPEPRLLHRRRGLRAGRAADRGQGPAGAGRRARRRRGLRRPHPARRARPARHARAWPTRRQTPAARQARPPRAAQSSSYGVRFDPFTRRPAFHSGLDFPGGRDDADLRHRARRGLLHRRPLGLRQHRRDRPRPRLQDPLRPPAGDRASRRASRSRSASDWAAWARPAARQGLICTTRSG